MGEPQQAHPEADLWLGRRALDRGLITSRNLTEALLAYAGGGMRKPLEAVLQERGLLSREQVRTLRRELAAGPTLRQDAVGDRVVAEARLGSIVNRVLCDAVLDVGRWITTYRGRLPRDPEPVQLQLISKQALRHGLWMDFLEVVRGCVGIDSPQLVDVLDVKPLEEVFAVVTRFQKGGITLRSLLRRVRRLKLSEALRITGELAQGLSVLHGAGLCHRDVKPENVLLGRTGGVQLMNAGVVFEPEGAERYGPRGSIFGTPHYMAPEALQGAPPDPKSDVYSLGVLAYELVSGVRPFEGDGLDSLREQHLENAPVPPHSVQRALPQEVGELVLWMLAKEPHDRPDPATFLEALSRVAKGIARSGHTQKFQALDPDAS
ncbi:MAG: serine/threonine protein kinase [Planctomycetota bacterium]|nr:MAG: serine/threonine protein kinase [Planctomycetota bacterium]